MKYILLSILLLLSFTSYSQIGINSGLTVAGQQSVDGKQYKFVAGKHVPYGSANEFLSIIPNTRRHLGQIAYILNGAIIEIWQFVGGIADINFKKVSVEAVYSPQWAVIDSISNPTTITDSIFEGSKYLVGTAAAGEWIGQANKIATRVSGAWTYQTAISGDLLYNSHLAVTDKFDGSSWIRVETPRNPAFPIYSIPFGGSGGLLTYQSPGFTYNPTSRDLMVGGTGNFGTSSQIRINSGNGIISASGWGVNIIASGGYPADASKSISFYNGSRQWMVMHFPTPIGPHTLATGPMYIKNYAHMYPYVTDSMSLGTPGYNWSKVFTKDLRITNGAGAGKVWTSIDGTGDGEWRDVAGSGTSGISQLGTSNFGLTIQNDSTYYVDSSKIATLSALQDTTSDIRELIENNKFGVQDTLISTERKVNLINGNSLTFKLSDFSELSVIDYYNNKARISAYGISLSDNYTSSYNRIGEYTQDYARVSDRIGGSELKSLLIESDELIFTQSTTAGKEIRLKTTPINTESTSRLLLLPNADGTLVTTVNGNAADSNGNITIATGGTGDMLKSENLSGLANYTTARTNLGLATVAATGVYNDLTGKPTLFSGAYADLTGKPTIPAAQINSDWNSVSGLSQILNKPVIVTAQQISDSIETNTVRIIPISPLYKDADSLKIKILSASDTGVVTPVMKASWDAKQAALVSGTSIKTINSTSLLGSGDIAVQPTLVSGGNIKTFNGSSILGSGNITISGGTPVVGKWPVEKSTGGGTDTIKINSSSAALTYSGSDVAWNYATNVNKTLTVANTITSLSITNDFDGAVGVLVITNSSGSATEFNPPSDLTNNFQTGSTFPAAILDGEKYLISYIRIGNTRYWNSSKRN